MFIEDEDWNDEGDAQLLSQTVLNKQANSNSTNVQSKSVGKKSLLRTLQTLGPVPDWQGDGHQRDSDSETETAPSHAKKKKKRRKRPKHASSSGEQEENGGLDLCVEEQKTNAKKKKKDDKPGTPKAETASADQTKTGEMTKSENKQEDTQRLSRKQWKSKMRNKRKCINKYRPNKPEEEVNKLESADEQRPKEVQTDSHSKNKNCEKTLTEIPNKIREKELGPHKRRNIDTARTERLEKQTKGTKFEKDASESLFDASKQKTGESEMQNQQQHQKSSKKPVLSKEQSQKRERLRKLFQHQEPEQQPESPPEQNDEPTVQEEEVQQDRSASLRSRMEQRLDSARFRYINEVLYSTPSGEAKRMFRQDPDAFWIYHRGYTSQVQRWPVNPVDRIISYIRQKPASLVVADFGCGDCKIARSVKNKVHSFDLAAACDLVTVCDMADVPLKDRSVDIAVFCLSLMGTNLADFLAEANRVLKMGGVLKIAEVASRFDNVRSFITALANLGFKMASKDTENSHFYAFDFVKTRDAPENIKKFGLQLKACVYKKR
ncbi:uncharacterized protein rrp8 [Aulostomus maculatus]